MNSHPVFNKFPHFVMEDIALRELSVDDAEDFYNYLSNPLVNKYLSDDDFPRSIDDAKEEVSYWSRLFYYKHSIYWGIEDLKKKKLIGTCGYNNWSKTHHRIEISYDLDVEYWGRGIMTKSVGRIIEFAQEELGVNRIQATVATDNYPSIKMLERLNFKQEGLLREYGILHAQKKDFYMYGVMKGEGNGR